MTPSELKYQVSLTRSDSHFFSRNNMKFAGDTMRNYGVRECEVLTYSGEVVPAWELYRKKPVKCGLKSSAYFCKSTFKQVFSAK